jgi:hypothetical protein
MYQPEGVKLGHKAVFHTLSMNKLLVLGFPQSHVHMSAVLCNCRLCQAFCLILKPAIFRHKIPIRKCVVVAKGNEAECEEKLLQSTDDGYTL